VPTRNSERTIEACLGSIRAQAAECTLVVVDNGSSDRTAELARRLADLVLDTGPERSAQRNLGARSRPAPIVGFIDSDMVLRPGVVEQARAAIEGGAASVVIPEITVGEGYWTRVRAFERGFYEGADDVEAARFFRYDAFEAAGRWDEEMTGGEDWDLTIRVRPFGPVARTEAFIEHDEGRVRYFDAVRKKGYYAEGLRVFRAKHGGAVLGQAVDRPYFHKPAKLLNPLGAGLVALKLGEAASVAAALTKSRIAREAQTRRRVRPGG